MHSGNASKGGGEVRLGAREAARHVGTAEPPENGLSHIECSSTGATGGDGGNSDSTATGMCSHDESDD